MTSGDLPDIIYDFHSGSTLKWANEGLLVYMDDYFDVCPNLQKLFNDSAYKYTTYNGKHYFYPQVCEYGNSGWNYRAAWAEKLNLSMPATTEDLYNMLKAFTEDDPDGNGSDDTYGMSGSGVINAIVMLFGIPSAGFMSDGQGGIVWSRVTDEFKQALEYTARLYADGYIYPEFYTESRDAFYENIIKGKYGVFPENTGIHAINRWVVPGKEINPEFELGYFNPLPQSPTGLPGGTGAIGGIYGGLFLTNAIEDLPGVLGFLDLMTTEEFTKLRHWGIEGKSYPIEADGSIKLNLEQRIADGFFGTDGLQYSDWACAGFLGALPFWWEGDKMIVSKKSQYNYTVKEYNPFAEESDLYAIETGKTTAALEMGIFMNLSQEMYDIKAKIEDITSTFALNVVIGEKSLDADWDAYIQQLNTEGLGEYTQAVLAELQAAGKVE
jgi:ABC-type glycerol-3-phosphate transport system substrate-binding protein